MIDSEQSGIAFSVHPVTQDHNHIIIEAGLGLGEAIVSGQITPDSYVIEKTNWNIIELTVNEQSKALYKKPGNEGGNEWKELGEKGKKQVLDEEEILELAKLIKKIEDHYGFPCDIEWAKENNKFYITQSRPITTLTPKTEEDSESKKKRSLKSDTGEGYVFHTTVSGFGVLFLDLVLGKKTYGEVDYRLLHENDISLFYLTKKGFKEAYDMGKKLLDEDFTKEILEDSNELISSLNKYKSPKLSDGNVIKEWEKYLKYCDEFMRLYRFYEQPFQQALEEVILREIPEKKLVEYFTNSDKKASKKRDFSGNVKEYIDRILELGKMKLKLHLNSEEYFTKCLEGFVEFVAKKNGISKEIIYNMRRDEFSDAIRGKKIDKNSIKKRLNGFIFVKNNKKWEIKIGEEYLNLKEKITGSQDKEIKGKVAFPGKVKGKVALHLSWTDTRDIEEGDILVTGMTNPQMIPFLKKAGGIVTDEGGITCHAAIISRELKKPCITGANTATQILKEGDLVELDATNGTVKILKDTNNNI
tara:strand:- start:977 stop:2563 length:1587 start_codon:yes stop_codon:yes gene_type:complete